jgi:general secretion pathway protein B
MSFILDALKKAESERNRQLGPVLMDARALSPRRAVPAWGWVLAAVLLANLIVLAWLLLRSPEPAAAPALAAPPDAPAPAAALVQASPATATPATPSAQAATSTPVVPVAATPIAAAPGSDPNVPAPPAAYAPPARDIQPSLSSDAEALPTAHELLAQGVSLPELQLNLHIYDPEPAHRSVLLNGQRLREGQFTPNGVRVERITEQSVVLEAQGRRFRIVAGG